MSSILRFAGWRLTVVAMVTAMAVHADDGPGARPPAPSFSATTLHHGDLALEDLGGRVVLLEFWASWCTGCIEGLPQLRALYERHAGAGFEIVGISLDEDLRAWRRAVARHEIPWPQTCDGMGKQSPLARSFDVRGTPRFVLIDRQGRVAADYVRPSELERAVRELLTAESTTPAETRT